MKDSELHLALQIPGGYGSEFASAWRLPGADKTGFIDADVFVAAAREAERGKLDAVFLADRAAIEDDVATSAPRSALEPVVLLAAMARETSRVGLVATSSTTYNYPYTVARQFRALDLVSGGRIGWNAVTTSSPLAALNHAEEVPSREYRYGRAHEFVTAVQALWGSWQDDALVLDAERDLLPQRALAGKVVLPLAIGGTLTHAPVIDYALRPVLTTLGTTEVVNGHFLLDQFVSFADGRAALAPEAERALSEALDQFTGALANRKASIEPVHAG